MSDTISLRGETYALVRDTAERPLVIVQRGPRMWRVASPHATVRVLAGLSTAPLRLVQETAP